MRQPSVLSPQGRSLYAIPVGLIDDEQGWTLRQEVFIDEKPPFYAFANDTEQLTEAQLFAQHSAE